MIAFFLAIWFATTPISGTKSRIVAGDSMVLELKELRAGRILAIEADMHSNKSDGAGNMCLTVGANVYHTIDDAPYSSPCWAGRYSNQEWDTLRWECAEPIRSGDVRMVVRASKNSLYVGQLRVLLEPDSYRPYSVTLFESVRERETLIESQIGEGVILPEVAEAYGWVDHVVERDSLVPIFWSCGSRYYPERDDTLYALYRTNVSPITPDTMCILTAGSYLVYEPYKALWMRGSMSAVNMIASSTDYSTWMPTDGRYTLVPENDSIAVFGGVRCLFRPGARNTWFISRCSDGKSLWPSWTEGERYTYEWGRFNYKRSTDYLYLFSAQPYPVTAPIRWWTTYPDGTGCTNVWQYQSRWSKVYEDGKIYIIRNDEANRIVYTLSGLRLH